MKRARILWLSPALLSLALAACGGSSPAGTNVGATTNAQCMRRHGVPNFPDPTFPSSGGIAIGIGPGVNPQSPAFKQAAAACGGPGGGHF